MRPQPFDWIDFLAFAQKQDHTGGEAAIRSAVSRAYYAVYWKARTRLQAQGITVPRGDAHKFVWDTYDRVNNADGESLGELGRTLRNRRNRADYEASPNMARSEMEIAIRDASSLIGDIDDLIKQDRERASKRATS